MQNLHVTIMGAGLGGLCLAQALKHAGIAFDVFERDAAPEIRGQGYRIRINAEGQHALEMCLPPGLYTLFRLTASVAASTGRFLTPQLAPVSGRVPDSWHTSVDADEDTDLSINRQTLREILICGIRGHLYFGQAFDHYTLTDDNLVEVFFQQATGPVVSHMVRTASIPGFGHSSFQRPNPSTLVRAVYTERPTYSRQTPMRRYIRAPA